MSQKQPDYARTTITVPRPLKRRMEAVEHRVNWSAVACQAFRARLEEFRQEVKPKTLDDVVERLRRQQSQQQDTTKPGGSAGRVWAMSVADLDQLQRLEAFREQYSEEEWPQLFTTEDGWREVGLAIAPSKSDRKVPKRPKAIWNRCLLPENQSDAETSHPDFFRNFADEALQVWGEVKDKL